jgi:hypothetical protein
VVIIQELSSATDGFSKIFLLLQPDLLTFSGDASSAHI